MVNTGLATLSSAVAAPGAGRRTASSSRRRARVEGREDGVDGNFTATRDDAQDPPPASRDLKKAVAVGAYLAASSAALTLQWGAMASRASACAPVSSTSSSAPATDTTFAEGPIPAFLASGGEWSQNRYKDVIEFYSRRAAELRGGRQHEEQQKQKQKKQERARRGEGRKPRIAEGAGTAGGRAEKGARSPAARVDPVPGGPKFSAGTLVRHQSQDARVLQASRKKASGPYTYRLEAVDGSRCFRNVAEADLSLPMAARAAAALEGAGEAAAAAAAAAAAWAAWAWEAAMAMAGACAGWARAAASGAWGSTSVALAQFDFSLSSTMTRFTAAVTTSFAGVRPKLSEAVAAAAALLAGFVASLQSLDATGVQARAREVTAMVAGGVAGSWSYCAGILAGITLPRIAAPSLPGWVASPKVALPPMDGAAISAKFGELSATIGEAYIKAASKIGDGFPRLPFFAPGLAALLLLVCAAAVFRRMRGSGEGSGKMAALEYEPAVVPPPAPRRSAPAAATSGTPEPPKVVPSSPSPEAGKEEKSSAADPLLMLGAAVSLGADAVGAAFKGGDKAEDQWGADATASVDEMVTSARTGLKNFGKEVTKVSKGFDRSMAKGGESVARAASKLVPSIEEEKDRKQREEEARRREEAERKVAEEAVAANVEEVEGWIARWKSRTKDFQEAVEKLERASNAGDQALVDSLFAKYDRTIPSFRERIQSMVVEEPEPAAKESSFELKKKEFTPKPIEAVRSKGAAAAPAEREVLDLEVVDEGEEGEPEEEEKQELGIVPQAIAPPNLFEAAIRTWLAKLDPIAALRNWLRGGGRR